MSIPFSGIDPKGKTLQAEEGLCPWTPQVPLDTAGKLLLKRASQNDLGSKLVSFIWIQLDVPIPGFAFSFFPSYYPSI